jgi:hypothetical protein
MGGRVGGGVANANRGAPGAAPRPRAPYRAPPLGFPGPPAMPRPAAPAPRRAATAAAFDPGAPSSAPSPPTSA